MQTLEVAFKEKYKDGRAKTLERKISQLNISVSEVRIIDLYMFDIKLEKKEAQKVKDAIFVDRITQRGSYSGLYRNFNWDWQIVVSYLPGVKDNEGKRSKRAIEDFLGKKVRGKVYTAKKYLLQGDLNRKEAKKIAYELLANKVIHKIQMWKKSEVKGQDLELKPPKVNISHTPQIEEFELASLSEKKLLNLSKNRHLALSRQDIKVIMDHFQNPKVIKERKRVGLSNKITDLELETIAQTQSEHCKHKIFNAEIEYINEEKNEGETIDSLFDTYIKRSTNNIKSERSWILSVFWDNAGTIEFNDNYAIAFKFETHNSPSAKEPFGGAMTGIVGVYRDIMGAGKGARPIAGSYGFCTPNPFYSGKLKPDIPPRRLLEGIVEGVRDGGNKSGIPTIYGYSKYDDSFLGKPLVYVGSVGIMPKQIKGKESWKKDLEGGDLIVTVGGAVGKDGIHGVTQASKEFSEDITSQHVQIGDPYTQKKIHDFIFEARDRALFKFIWDLGGGGLSSAVGETARFSDGCEVHLDRVPLKYEGLDPWEILLSESQERMLLGVAPDKFEKLKKLAEKHDVRITQLGKYKEHGIFHVLWHENTVAYLDMEFLHEGFPQLKLEATWNPKERKEPSLPRIRDHEATLKKMLGRINIASKEWIQRQFDHEVQGTSVIKPYTGKNMDVKSDAAIISPLYDSNEGLALALGNKLKYSQIDTYWAAACSLDESIRRVLSVGANLHHIALNDNFCWPNSLYDPEKNPDGKEKLGQLVRANKALYRFTTAFKTPCISGKDSMFIDGRIESKNGEIHKVSGLPSLQFAALGKIENVEKSVTLTPKQEGDFIYLIGETRDELGASEYYEMKGKTGRKIPKLKAKETYKIYSAISKATDRKLLESCTGCYRGGLGIALARKAMAGETGLKVQLKNVPTSLNRLDKILYSETPSRFVVTVKPKNTKKLETVLNNLSYSQIGTVTSTEQLVINYGQREIIETDISDLKKAYKTTFGDF